MQTSTSNITADKTRFFHMSHPPVVVRMTQFVIASSDTSYAEK